MPLRAGDVGMEMARSLPCLGARRVLSGRASRSWQRDRGRRTRAALPRDSGANMTVMMLSAWEMRTYGQSTPLLIDGSDSAARPILGAFLIHEHVRDLETDTEVMEFDSTPGSAKPPWIIPTLLLTRTSPAKLGVWTGTWTIQP